MIAVSLVIAPVPCRLPSVVVGARSALVTPCKLLIAVTWLVTRLFRPLVAPRRFPMLVVKSSVTPLKYPSSVVVTVVCVTFREASKPRTLSAVKSG